MLGAIDSFDDRLIGCREDGKPVIVCVAGRRITDKADQRTIQPGRHPFAELRGVDEIKSNDTKRARIASTRNHGSQATRRESGIDDTIDIQSVCDAHHIQPIAEMATVPEPRVTVVQRNGRDPCICEGLRQIDHTLLAAQETMADHD